MISRGWLVRTYPRALAIIFAYVLLLASGFDLVGMGQGLRMCVSNTFRGYWLSTVFGRAVAWLSHC